MSMIGKSLVHYEITAEIGKGGMGNGGGWSSPSGA
jgi:hypothetical protein